ncbi:hypothetical protein [Rossellomorea vietnamensis]|uniref:YcxB-like protein domain-containing protein n=1 Tax=Rossellomorea vietnamensis TaxID=218284 RepID=A0A0P6WDN3_9BACI|nr:hypothetical protein [Rossellomorea vietnamensis]KPL58323.1 hypothetical protein AM506_17020 [Rossellomorea vietnamensis]
MQKKTFTFKLSDEGYYELLKYMPYFRKVHFFGNIGVFVISTVLFLYYNHAFQESASPSSPVMFEFILQVMFPALLAFGLSLVVHFLLYLYFRFRINAFLKKSARRLKEKYQQAFDEEYMIVFDQDQNAFLLGNRQHRIGQNLKVVSTSKHLLFYDGDGKSQTKFYIPKDGDRVHQENVAYIKDYLMKTSGVQYEEKGKRLP